MEKLQNRKKGQYYMFGAIIFIVAVFSIYYSKSTLSVRKLEDVSNLRENYLYEGSNIINSAIYYKSNISEAMRNYTESFIQYVESDISALDVLYMYSKDGEIYVTSYVDDEIAIENNGNLAYSQEKVIDFTESVGISYENETYYYNFQSPEKTELKVMIVASQ